MKRNDLVKGIDAVIEGLNIIKNSLLDDENTESAPKETVEEAPKSEPKKEEKTGSAYSEEELVSMKYNDLKNLASELGIPNSGTRAKLIERIMASDSTKKTEDTIEGKINPPVEAEEKEEKKVIPIGGKKKLSKKTEVKEETVDKKFLDMADEALKEMSEDDLKDMLDDVDVKIEKGETVAHAFARALAEGKIEASDDDEEETSTEATPEDTKEESSDDEEVTGEDYFSDYDKDGINDYSGEYMTKKRKKAMIAWQTKFLEDYDKDKITLDDVTEAIQTLCTQDELDAIDAESEDDIVCTYMEIMKRCIDDDGDLHEGGDAYEINDEYFCCGHKLKEVDGKFVCEVCGAEYEQKFDLFSGATFIVAPLFCL